MIEYKAVLIVGHFIVSIFNIQLGQPIFQFFPMDDMAACEEQIQYHQIIDGVAIDGEWKMYKEAQCMTREEFEAALAAARG